MRGRLWRSLWVVGPIIYAAGLRFHVAPLEHAGAAFTVLGLFYGYWPRPRGRRRPGRPAAERGPTVSAPASPSSG